MHQPEGLGSHQNRETTVVYCDGLLAGTRAPASMEQQGVCPDLPWTGLFWVIINMSPGVIGRPLW